MADNPKKKKADGKRVALKQEHEREYVLAKLSATHFNLNSCRAALVSALGQLDSEQRRLEALSSRVRAGFPKTKRKR